MILVLVATENKGEPIGYVVKVGESYAALDEQGDEYLSNRPEVFSDLETATDVAVLFE